MSKTSLLYRTFALLAVVLGFYACEREDGEPNLEMRQFTRLYISFEEDVPRHQRQPDFANLRIIYPADSSEFTFNGGHASYRQGGGTLYFAPELSALFQASLQPGRTDDTVISVLSVGSSGAVNNAAELKSRYYNNVKGMAYHRGMNVLFVVNGTGPDAGVYVIDAPRYANMNEKQPVQKLRNSSLSMWGAAYANDRLFASKTTANPAGLYVFDGITSKEVSEVDSIGSLTEDRILEIEGATSLRGLFYDTVRNVMAVTDMSDGAGRILIFENFSSLVESETPITPTRVIAGANTGLMRPMDVVLDTREEGTYLYVADNTAHKIFRFLYTDDGDVEPDKVMDTSDYQYGRTPVSLALDPRLLN